MGHPGLSGRRGVQRDACASGKRRNAPEKPGCPTGGWVILRRGVVARLCPNLLMARCIAMRRAPSHDAESGGQIDRIRSEHALDVESHEVV